MQPDEGLLLARCRGSVSQQTDPVLQLEKLTLTSMDFWR